jgi:coenzyme F420-reducing hydrogenase delta subunit/NAD-dependent dihydropyrimidine dehydrogenase PreA subunit
MEVVRIASLGEFPAVEAKITPAALAIGGGIAGMTAALELADAGIPVTLVERKGTLGGRAITENSELEAELAIAVQAHPHICLELNSHIANVTGSLGTYYVTITPPGKGERHGPFGTIIVATGKPDEETKELAELLRLPQDADGFLPEWRVRLRPGHHLGRGIYVCGAVHSPCDMAEAQFQAYSTASRALHHLRRGPVTVSRPVAQVDPEKCNGCSDCFQVCPFSAVTMVEGTGGAGSPNFDAPDRPVAGLAPPYGAAARAHLTPPDLHSQPRPIEGQGPITVGKVKGGYPERVAGLSVSVIDPLLCTGCGNCVSACPVGAVTVTGWTEVQLEAQMRVALRSEGRNSKPRILVFACEWSGFAAAELAGAHQLRYPADVRLIRLGCSGRLQPGLILKAFELGAAGVLVLGCGPRLCHYEQSNERLAAACGQVEALNALLGLPANRLKLAWTPPDNGLAFAELVTGFAKEVEESIEAVV